MNPYANGDYNRGYDDGFRDGLEAGAEAERGTMAAAYANVKITFVDMLSALVVEFLDMVRRRRK